MTERIYDKSFLFSEGWSYSRQVDVMIDQNAIIENDGRSTTRTFFYVDDATYNHEGHRQMMFRLMKLNDGVYEKGRSTANYRADLRRFCDTVTSQLEMTNYQQERVKHVMMDMHLNSFGPYSGEKITLAVVSLVANADRRLIRDEEKYRELVEDVDSTLKEMKRLRQMVLDRTEAFS